MGQTEQAPSHDVVSTQELVWSLNAYPAMQVKQVVGLEVEQVAHGNSQF